MMMLLKMCAATFIVLLVVSPPNKVDTQEVGTLSDWRVFHFYLTFVFHRNLNQYWTNKFICHHTLDQYWTKKDKSQNFKFSSFVFINIQYLVLVQI